MPISGIEVLQDGFAFLKDSGLASYQNYWHFQGLFSGEPGVIGAGTRSAATPPA